MANLITRRSFLQTSFQATLAASLASVMHIPPFLQRALAEGNIGISGKKLLFIFLRGGNDGINNLIPIQDPSYAPNRLAIALPKDGAVNYGVATGVCDTPGAGYPYGINLGNGFAALNPNLYDLAPLYNTGKLALLHRVGYRSQSRSHFDSEVYWEKGSSGSRAEYSTISDGMFYRAMVESGWNQNHALSGVSIQSNMPQCLRGQQPMTNLSSINRYNLLGVASPSGSTNTDRIKLLNAIDAANLRAMPVKDNRDLVSGLGTAFRDTLDIFQSPTFATNDFKDTDGTTHLFPIDAASDQKGFNSNNAYDFFNKIKAAAQVLANTDAVIAGTEMGGFDTHTGQVTMGSPHLGGHGSLLKRIGWAFYALSKFFGNIPKAGGGTLWDDVVVVTMSEFGRTSAENGSVGTDHAEASVMYVAGGSVNGGIHGCSDTPTARFGTIKNWDKGDGGKNGSMFVANSTVGYLRRLIDYRSVMGEIIRDHLGATQGQLERIIPGYANDGVEKLLNGIAPGPNVTTPIVGEVGIL